MLDASADFYTLYLQNVLTIMIIEYVIIVYKKSADASSIARFI